MTLQIIELDWIEEYQWIDPPRLWEVVSGKGWIQKWSHFQPYYVVNDSINAELQKQLWKWIVVHVLAFSNHQTRRKNNRSCQKPGNWLWEFFFKEEQTCSQWRIQKIPNHPYGPSRGFSLWHAPTIITFPYVKALTHYTQNCKDFSKKSRWENRCSYKKLLEKSLQLWKKVVVCMEDNHIFCSFVCSVRGP